MKDLGTFFLVGSGGFLGANARYWLGTWIHSRFDTAFPWNTLAINVTGSFLIGIFMGLSIANSWTSGWRLLIAVGLLGGYTTFSAFSYESISLLSKGAYTSALGYIAASVALSIGATWLGIALTKTVPV